MLRNIFLVNCLKELKECQKYILSNKIENYSFVALSRSSLVQLKKKKIQYNLIDEYTSSYNLNSLGLNNFDLLELVCEKLDKLVHKEIKKIEEINVHPFKYNFYFLKFLLDTITAKILILENFLNHESIKKNNVFFVNCNNKEMIGDIYPINDNANIYSVILKNLFNRDNIHLINPKIRVNNRKKTLENINLITQLFKNILKKFINFFPSKKKKYVIFSYGHDLNHLTHKLKKNNFKEYYINKDKKNFSLEIYEKCKLVWQKINSDEEIKKLFTFENKNYYSILNKYLQFYVINIIPKSISNYFYIKKIISTKKIHSVLTGSTNLGLNMKCMLNAFQSNNIPVITYTEGAGYGSYTRPIAEYTEYLFGDILFCYGSGNIEYFKSSKKKSNKKLIPVGSARQFKIFKKFNNSKIPKKINSIMYISNFFKDNWVTIPYGCKTGLEYFENQIKILDYLNTLKNSVNIFIKPHPNDYHFKEILNLELYKDLNIRLDTMENSMQDIDLFIIDYPSTTLLDVLNTNSFIFLLRENNGYEFSTIQKKKILKRVYFFENFRNMKTSINDILKNTNQFSPKIDDSFLIDYSLFKKEDPTDLIIKNLNNL